MPSLPVVEPGATPSQVFPDGGVTYAWRMAAAAPTCSELCLGLPASSCRLVGHFLLETDGGATRTDDVHLVCGVPGPGLGCGVP